MNRTSLIIVAVALIACGGRDLTTRTLTSSQALTGTAEWLEFETAPARAELFRDVVRQSQLQAGKGGVVLFPMIQGNGEISAAPALDLKVDLLQVPDGGASIMLAFDTRGERFADDRRDAFQGLSEREATELVARSLLLQWGVRSASPIAVVRAPGAPWAAALMDGELRINPAFVYLATSSAN